MILFSPLDTCVSFFFCYNPSYKTQLFKRSSQFLISFWSPTNSLYSARKISLLFNCQESGMALICKPSSSAPLGERPWKIQVKLMRIWKEGKKKGAGNSIEIVLLQSSTTSIHTTIDEALSKWIMDISHEKINGVDTDIDIPKDLLTIGCGDPIKTIVREVYGDSFALESHFEPDFCHETAILCHTDADVDRINSYMLSLLPGEEKLCYSDDCIPPLEKGGDYTLLSPKFFACVQVPGVPPQVLRLKVGAPVMLLTDIDPGRGLCTGARLQIIELGDSMLMAHLLTDYNHLKRVVIPKTHMFAAKNFVFQMRRTQYPLTLAFAMTMNKSRGQSFPNVGLYLPRQVFSHGQRYVAISKVKTRAGLKVLITDKDGKPQEETEDVVFQELFQNA